MANLSRVRVSLTGLRGLPGVCTFYGVDGSALVGPLFTLFSAIATVMPAGIRIQVENTGDVVDPSNGSITDTWAGQAQTLISGADAGVYAAPSGLCLTWLTTTILDGRRVKGRTFIVPLGAGAYQGDGSLNDGIAANIRGMCVTFQTATAANFTVWHRPRLARAATPTRKALSAHVGAGAPVTGSRVADTVAVLRSRRD